MRVIVVAVAVVTTLLGGLYTPSLMTAFYNEEKASPCATRFQFAAEGGWDVGGVGACLLASALLTAGAPLQIVIALAIPAVLIQARVLDRAYEKHRAALQHPAGAAAM